MSNKPYIGSRVECIRAPKGQKQVPLDGSGDFKNPKPKNVQSMGKDAYPFRLGPEIYFENVEVTPIPLWPDTSRMMSSIVLQKDSYEIITIEPTSRETKDRTESGDSNLFAIKSTKTPGGIEDFDQLMTDLDSDTKISIFPAKKKQGECPNLESSVNQTNLAAQQKEEVYVTIPYKTALPDGTHIYKDHIRVAIKETPTQFHLARQGHLVPKGGEEEKQAIQRNERYKMVCKLHRESDIFTSRECQTFGGRDRVKGTQCKPIRRQDQCVQVQGHEIYDAFKEQEEQQILQKEHQNTQDNNESSLPQEPTASTLLPKKEDEDEDSDEFSEGQSSPKQSKMMPQIDWRLYKEPIKDLGEFPGSLSDCDSDEGEFEVNRDLERVIKSKEKRKKGLEKKAYPDIRLNIMTMERMISMSTHQDKQAELRGFPVYPKLKDPNASKPHYFNLVPIGVQKHRDSEVLGPSMKRFWKLKNSFTTGKEVTHLILHPKNGNIIGASYGSCTFGNQVEGLVCIWNAKNIQSPERTYHFSTSVTSISFSTMTPYLIAIGLFDGNVLVYDIRKESDSPAVSSTMRCDDKHFGPVWQVHWMKEHLGGTQFHEVLISVGDDGFINRWICRKGTQHFEPFVILNIKRSPLKIPGRREKRAEALISQLSAAYSQCFYPNDHSIYLIGTEEGFIHKCTNAYSEQYITTFVGHSGPIYRIQFSPFDDSIFVSCSGDWTMRIWRDETPTPLLTLRTGLSTIYDVTCCQILSTAFICVSEDHVEVWNIGESTQEPIIKIKNKKPLRKAIYSDELKSLVIGDADGGLQFFGLKHFSKEPKTFDEQVDLLRDALGLEKEEREIKEEESQIGQGDEGSISRHSSAEEQGKNGSILERMSTKDSSKDESSERTESGHLDSSK